MYVPPWVHASRGKRWVWRKPQGRTTETLQTPHGSVAVLLAAEAGDIAVDKTECSPFSGLVLSCDFIEYPHRASLTLHDSDHNMAFQLEAAISHSYAVRQEYRGGWPAGYLGSECPDDIPVPCKRTGGFSNLNCCPPSQFCVNDMANIYCCPTGNYLGSQLSTHAADMADVPRKTLTAAPPCTTGPCAQTRHGPSIRCRRGGISAARRDMWESCPFPAIRGFAKTTSTASPRAASRARPRREPPPARQAQQLPTQRRLLQPAPGLA